MIISLLLGRMNYVDGKEVILFRGRTSGNQSRIIVNGKKLYLLDILHDAFLQKNSNFEIGSYFGIRISDLIPVIGRANLQICPIWSLLLRYRVGKWVVLTSDL